MRIRRRLFVTALALGALGWSDALTPEALRDELDKPAPEHVPRHAHARRTIDGAAFPDGVVALTWDDGPDRRTLELARWLRARRVSGTFFVVRGWIDGVSEEPGRGADALETGYAHLPVLGELVRLGHRLGNHTSDHVVLADAALTDVAGQLAGGQAALDPFLTNELRMFRPPGGYWSSEASSAIATRAFATTVGPIGWDIDRKDWECSLYCRSAKPHDECERSAKTDARVRADVVAARYVAAIERAKKGIVLLHDRVGDVGSRYALDVARALVPALEERGFVFTAPVLGFGALARRAPLTFERRSLRLVDVDGDGRADLCGVRHGRVLCARSFAAHAHAGALPFTSFRAAELATAVLPPHVEDDARYGDLNGDGRVDRCSRTPAGVACALSNGRVFTLPTIWLDTPVASFELGDINGDGRADLCAPTGGDIACALAP